MLNAGPLSRLPVPLKRILRRLRRPLSRYSLAYDPALVPPPAMMRHHEGTNVLEEWFRWSHEWGIMLRIYGGITPGSIVLEIGCGLGRIAFALRPYLWDGRYEGFDICESKVAFLNEGFARAFPNFRFTWADVRNTFYNPQGRGLASEYRFPYADATFDLVFAASVFTHMLPEGANQYFRESARVLKRGGRCVFSFFLLDHYRPGEPRWPGFRHAGFEFVHPYGAYGNEFAISVPANPEEMTAYRLSLVERLAASAGFALARPPVPGFWSAHSPNWVSAQDMVVLVKS